MRICIQATQIKIASIPVCLSGCCHYRTTTADRQLDFTCSNLSSITTLRYLNEEGCAAPIRCHGSTSLTSVEMALVKHLERRSRTALPPVLRMFPLLFSVLSGVRELSATASLEGFRQSEAPPRLSIMPGVSSRDLIASLCPVAAALIVATVRYYNEKRMQQRTSDPHAYFNPLLTFEDINIASYKDCGDLRTVLGRCRSETFYISDDSIVVFRVCNLNLLIWVQLF